MVLAIGAAIWAAVVAFALALAKVAGNAERRAEAMREVQGKPYWYWRHTVEEMDLLDRLTGVHEPDITCATVCPIHRPSDGPHRLLPWHWRNDRGIFERICEHGVGHPDPDQMLWWMTQQQASQAMHGCDGCCFGWPLIGLDLEEET